MSRTAKSIFVFGIYVILLGLTLVFIPNTLLKTFKVAETNEVWIRILGMVLLFLGYLYMRASMTGEEMRKFFTWTVHTRSTVIVFLTAFVLLDMVEPVIILFGVIDLAGAAWTALTLRTKGA